MSVTKIFEGHTSILLDSGRFLFIPAITEREPAEFKQEDGSVDQLSIRAQSGFPPAATVHGRTLHVTLASAEFRRLGARVAARGFDAAIEVTYDVDAETGDVTNLVLDGQSLVKPYARGSQVRELGPSGKTQAAK